MTKNRPSSNTIILGVETANPAHSLDQQEVLAILSGHLKLSAKALALYRRFLLDEGISRRYFAWDSLPDFLSESVDDKMQRFERWAVSLAVEAADKLFKQFGCAASDVDALFVSTCTGYLCPGLSTYVSQGLGLRENIHALDLVGLGCVGALPALRAADDYLNRYPDSTVLVIAAEICSAAVHWGDRPELILSNSIFSDGAAAVLLTGREGSKGLKINAISSLLWPQFRNQLRFKYLDARLCNVISAGVPAIAARAIQTLCQRSFAPETSFAFHSGGRKVLDAIQERLGLDDEDMRPSRRVLREYGNMSSPSVLFSLKDILNGELAQGHPVVCFSFGAGFLASTLEAEWQSGRI
jgi:predicted naringenin-chalcone synthase